MSQWDDLIQAAGQKYNVDPRLIASVVHVESGGDPRAYNAETGATGLGQQIPDTARRLGIDPKDPAQSIDGAARLLDENLRRYGNPEQAVLAYHGGTDQSNWGPKTQAYLGKVSAQYGVPDVARSVPNSDDFAAQDFAAPVQSATADAATDFAAQDFTAPAPAASPAATPSSVTGVVAQPQQSASEGRGVLDRGWEALGTLGEMGINNANAAGRGILDVLDAPSEWLASGAEASGLTGLLNRNGIPMPTYSQQVAQNKASRDEYEARTTGGIQQGVSRMAGNVAGVMVPIAGAESALVAGGGALSNALGNPQVLTAAGNFLRGNGGILSRMTYGAGQGAAGGALLSGGQPDTTLGEHMTLGAALGGALPVGIAGLQYGRDTIRALVDPFTNAGQTRVAQNILQRIAGGERIAADVTTYVPGSTPTLAQATRNPMVAALERAAEGRSSLPFGVIKDQNYAARNAYLADIKGTQGTLTAAIAKREQEAIPLLESAMVGRTPANAKPVLDEIDSILKTEAGQRDDVVRALLRVREKIDRGSTSGLQDDALQLYGIHKSISDQLETVAGRDNSAKQLASRELLQVQEKLEDVISKAAPGFKDYLKKYAELSKPINAQEYLQKLDLTDQTSQRITLDKVKRALVSIERKRAAPGSNRAKSISDEQMSMLRNLQADLQREANSGLGRTPGSNTFQNLAMDNLTSSMMPGALGRLPFAPETIGGALGLLLGGPSGAAIGGVAGRGVRGAMNSQSPVIEARLIDLLTDPNTALSRPNGAQGLLLQRLGIAGANAEAQRSEKKPAAK